jgi:hypothetical protein
VANRQTGNRTPVSDRLDVVGAERGGSAPRAAQVLLEPKGKKTEGPF